MKKILVLLLIMTITIGACCISQGALNPALGPKIIDDRGWRCGL